MVSTLVLPEKIATEVSQRASESVETAGVLLVSIVPEGDGDLRILGREMWWCPEEAYAHRESDSLGIRPEGYIEALRRAEEIKATAVWLHTHTGEHASTRPSRNDEVVDQELMDLFRLRTGSSWYGALIVNSNDEGLSFSGRVSLGDSAFDIGRLWIVGNRLSLRTAENLSDKRVLPSMLDRNVRALGGDVQRILNDLAVGIVGCGGTGSAVSEQLVRLGVRRITLFDPDVLSESNLTRVYGSRPTDVGNKKVEVIADHLQQVAPEVQIGVFASMITQEPAAREIRKSDVIFGCTDDNAGRMILSRLATYYLIPTFDCGVLITSGADGIISGIDARTTILIPDAACLICRGRIDLTRAASELLTPGERLRRQDEGYAPALIGIEPAVIPYTTLVAAITVGELLERLVSFGPEPVPSEILVRCHEREVSTNLAAPMPGHYCDPAEGLQGIGDTDPFLGLTWAS